MVLDLFMYVYLYALCVCVCVCLLCYEKMACRHDVGLFVSLHGIVL